MPTSPPVPASPQAPVPTTPLSTPTKSRYKRKPTDCFNDPAFIKLFSQQLRINEERSNKANSCPNANSSLQVGLTTPPAAFTELPGSNSPVVGQANIVLQDSTMQASRNNATAQNMTPTSRGKRCKKRKFYVVTRGRRTGVFNSWFIVEPLVNGIPGNCHASFDSHEEALEEYEAAKRRDDLRIIWITAEDAITYGPERKNAIM